MYKSAWKKQGKKKKLKIDGKNTNIQTLEVSFVHDDEKNVTDR